jgi:hypothetical protein
MSYRSVGMPVRSRKSLLIRGGAARTFGSIVAFLAALLLTVGAYVLIEVIAHPLAGGPAEIIGAAVLIALAAIMIFYLIEPRASAKRRRRKAKLDISAVTTVLLPLTPAQRQLPFEAARATRGSAADELSYEFTLRLSESPRDSVPQEGAGDAVHGRR